MSLGILLQDILTHRSWAKLGPMALQYLNFRNLNPLSQWHSFEWLREIGFDRMWKRRLFAA